MRDADALTQAFADGLERFGRLDVLVNVAGGTFKADFLDTNVRGWDAIIRANFGWLLHSTQLAARQMVDQGEGGSIITLTSIEGHRAAPGYAVYAGMKAAVTNFSRTLALELAPQHPRQLHRSRLHADRRHARATDQRVVETGIPMGRLGTYQDIGGCALFLASDLSTTSPAPPCTPTAARSRRRAGSTGRVSATGTCRRSPPSASSHERDRGEHSRTRHVT